MPQPFGAGDLAAAVSIDGDIGRQAQLACGRRGRLGRDLAGAGMTGRGRGSGMTGDRRGSLGAATAAAAPAPSRRAPAQQDNRAATANGSSRPRELIVRHAVKAVASAREDWSCRYAGESEQFRGTMPIRAILFDKDGTLVDFQRTWGPATHDGDDASFATATARRSPGSPPSSLYDRGGAPAAAGLAGRDRDDLRIRQIVGAGARRAADGRIRATSIDRLYLPDHARSPDPDGRREGAARRLARARATGSA